jgi:hypothetical protein
MLISGFLHGGGPLRGKLRLSLRELLKIKKQTNRKIRENREVRENREIREKPRKAPRVFSLGAFFVYVVAFGVRMRLACLARSPVGQSVLAGRQNPHARRVRSPVILSCD